MSLLTRVKKTVGTNLSAGLMRDNFHLNYLTHHGIHGTISTMHFDPVQGLLAVGTYEGSVDVLGQSGVQVTFHVSNSPAIRHVRLHGPRLVVVDAKNALTIFSLETCERTSVYSARGLVTYIHTDPSLDWLFIGLSDGTIDVWDLDRERIAPFRVPNLYKERQDQWRFMQYKWAPPRSKISPVVAIQMHPRDIGLLLVGYPDGAALFSFKEQKAIRFWELEIPPGAPGGDTDPSMIQTLRRPCLTSMSWHPSGVHLVTAHEDGCMAFWDAKAEGGPLQTRTLTETEVDIPGHHALQLPHTGTFSVREPIFRMSWCSLGTPEETELVVAGGLFSGTAAPGLTLLDFGPLPGGFTKAPTPQQFTEYYSMPRRTKILPTMSSAMPLDFVVFPYATPHYLGTHNPTALLVLLSTNELALLGFPDGRALDPAQVLPPALALLAPRALHVAVTPVTREKWLGMTGGNNGKSAGPGDQLLIGGAPARQRLRAFGHRNVMMTSHADGTIRLWDASHGEVENSSVLTADLRKILGEGRDGPPRITKTGLSKMTGELAVGTEEGECIVYRFGKTRAAEAMGAGGAETAMGAPRMPTVEELEAEMGGATMDEPEQMEMPPQRAQPRQMASPHLSPDPEKHSKRFSSLLGRRSSTQAGPKSPALPQGVVPGPQTSKDLLQNISHMADPAVASGFLPVCAVRAHRGGVTCVKTTDVGFIAIGYEYGAIALVDMRGPAVILLEDLVNLKGKQGEVGLETPTCFEVAVMSLQEGARPNILLFTGTSAGRIICHKLVPTPHGGYSVQFEYVNSHSQDGPIVALLPIELDTGLSAVAMPANLRTDVPIDGGIIAASAGGVRLVKGDSHKTRASFPAQCTAAIILSRDTGDVALACVMDSRRIRVLSIPFFEEIADMNMAGDIQRLEEAVLTENGDLFIWTGAAELGLFSLWHTGGRPPSAQQDQLFDALKATPARPTISTWQWVTGTVYVNQQDLDLLIGGPNRPLSKKMLLEQRVRDEQQRLAARAQAQAGMTQGIQNDANSGVFGQMVQNLSERGERLGTMENQFDHLEQATGEWLKEIKGFAGQTKRKAVMKGLGFGSFF
ncbi:Lethal(2) giant larvae sro7 [Saitoella coloradoensis]